MIRMHELRCPSLGSHGVCCFLPSSHLSRAGHSAGGALALSRHSCFECVKAGLGVQAGSESQHLLVPSFVSVLTHPGLGFPDLKVFMAPFVLKAGLWLTHSNTVRVHCCCTTQHLRHEENSHDRAAGPSRLLLPLTTAHLPVLPLNAAAPHSPGWQRAGCTMQICPCCHLPGVLSLASHAGLRLVGWLVDRVPHPTLWCLPMGAGGDRKGPSLWRLKGPQFPYGATGRLIVTSRQKHAWWVLGCTRAAFWSC